MRGKKLLLGLAAVAVVASAFTVLTGCEKDKSGTDLDRYFEDNPYVSDPRSGPDSRKLEIDPATRSVTAIGEKIRFAVNGGAGSTYRWDVANTAHGTIERQSNTRHAIYTVKQLADNSVIVSDSDGSAAIAYVTVTPVAFAIVPASVTYVATNAPPTITLLATGGTTPYGNWNIIGANVVTIAVPSANPGLFTPVANAQGTATITIEDFDGQTATATITAE